ncbi:lysophospholipid acyltransferase family protein [Pseudonocardia humida]|uniref:1-acyl-sn-glycerol-3-phosphate acyltransferase n=1 Tax=Pseudonocardia humida TaxID=2800819 RepID=A0ABT1ACZ2_9PSEU|nr:lysophospholipid acyltransferase family protein [Pseudonocardia humida]MCO1660785.1 1-acyl-sn-glycerol-3-phosphate acyltransferase [Pseudonocardia humida]
MSTTATGAAPDLPPTAWPWLHGVAKWLGTWLFRPFLRVRVHHLDRVPAAGAVVLVANHSAMVDGPLLFGLIRRRSAFLVKQEMFVGPLGWGLVRIGQIAVRRGEADRRALTTALGVLRGGGLVGVFPEGTRGAGDVRAAQHGAAWLARASGAVVVPVVCRGTHRPAGARRRWRPRVDVMVGEPLQIPTGGGRTGLTTGTETVRAELARMVRELDHVRSTA